MNIRRSLWLWMLVATAPLAAQQSSPARLHMLSTLPDWSGLWETELSASLDSGEFARSLAAAGRLSDGALSIETELFKQMTILGKPPYNPQWQQKYADSVRHFAGAVGGTPKTCTMGFPVVLDAPVADGIFQVLVTPEDTLFLYRDGEVRHIYTDGRAHPKPEDRWPTEMGDSVGRWEGATLIIDTIDRKAGPLAPFNLPAASGELSGDAHFIERLRRIDRDTMEDELTIDDPARFIHPWQLSFRYKRVTNLDRLIASNCTENDRNPVVDGKVTIAPPRRE